jgi:hypothetical protein
MPLRFLVSPKHHHFSITSGDRWKVPGSKKSSAPVPPGVMLGSKRHTKCKGGKSAYDPPSVRRREVPTQLSIKRGAYFEYATAQAKGEGPTPGTQIQRLLPVN